MDKLIVQIALFTQKLVEMESPHAVLPNTVFETVLKIPYDLKAKQILASDKRWFLNFSAVVILSKGLTWHQKNKYKKIKEKFKVFKYQFI